MKDVKVSFVVPTLNRFNYLKMTINSIMNQKSSDYEIIVSENNCNDGTKEWLKCQKNIITIYRDYTIDMFSNWNEGIKKAKGDYIVVLSDDDLVSDNMVEIIKNISDIYTDLGMIIFNHKCIDENGRLIYKHISKYQGLCKRQKAFKIFENGVNNRVCAIAFKKTCLEKCNYFDEKFKWTAADSKLIQQISIISDVYFVKENDKLPSYRIWTNSFTSTKLLTEDWHKQIRFWCDDMMDFTKKYMKFDFTRNKDKIILDNYKTAIHSNFESHLLDKFIDIIPGKYKNLLKKESNIFLKRYYYKEWQKKMFAYIEKIFQNCKGKNIGIYGTGKHSLILFNMLQKYYGSIDFNIYFFDSNENVVGNEFFNYKILSSKEILNYTLDKIVISSYSFQKEIYEDIKYLKLYEIEIIKIYKDTDYIFFG